jgi:hypothetical protein
MSRSPKRVSNEKEDRGDFVIYYMRRLIGNEVRGYNVAVTRRELEDRDIVAWRLRDARECLMLEVEIARRRLALQQIAFRPVSLELG